MVSSAEFENEYFRERTSVIDEMRRFFSSELYFGIKRIIDSLTEREVVEEIRIRQDKQVNLTVGSYVRQRNFATGIVVRADELASIFERMCDGSLYAYSESIIKGYITLLSGIRVGVCGHASIEKERIFGVYDISALNIRIPHSDICVDTSLMRVIRKNIRAGEGTLIFSPPAQGKTTCLRSIAYELSCKDSPMRVSVVDTRGELSFMPRNDSLSLDTLIGYPKAEGIRIATLFMNPEVIICDEIGGEDEAVAIVDAQNCGVPLIATAHAATISSLMLKKSILAMHNAGVFGGYVSLRIGTGGAYDCTFYNRGEAEKELENNRCAYNNF